MSTRLGMLTPSSNTVLEPYASAIVGDLEGEVTAHFQRFEVQEITLAEKAMAQFSLEPMLAAAELLTHARMDVIAWAGTSGSWQGLDRDEALCAEISRRFDVPATTSALAVRAILQATRPARLGLVTPYLGDVQTAIARNYDALGFPVHAERHLEDRGNFSFAEYDDDHVADLVGQVIDDGADAVVVLCTNFRGARVAAAIEEQRGVPVYDSITATVWHCLQLCEAPAPRAPAWGSLLAERIAADSPTPGSEAS